ncbi:LLM class flavin-dependent oxidoreductase [Nonomuraea pusilla]|uniref:Flavin-dependent oxidoreductase, luciferase family (Includes alkanesulfonate monooxygenase SsuD and methylene tetrahydromethanopterin reductase) n=1 Tax=Nonomuraea pusilla TaxID=46177 RepID=A0A1H8DEW9_9ACTN|nr:LLM class flavin-dependent oxidoreductase [Nonomuraea pusilla]SEN05098.1 Flavin-dependent oxidoreductase, luciferase family (includes alkanesulfonate monooxygenase SsuD and methylene tetrahydromethanopterin reductase) [Nonomuraea pusilla]
MRVGVFLVAAGFPGRDPGLVLRDTLELIVAAEEAGFDDAWVAEHHFMSYGVCPSPLTLLAAAAGRTRRLGLGTAVSVLSTQHPVALAEQAAMLHHLSGGRFTLGVGRGGPWVDLEVFGTGIERFDRGFAETLDLLLAAFATGRATGRGEFFRFREVELVPRAPLRPVVACTSSPTIALAAARGLPMLLGMHIDDAAKAALVTEYAALSGPGGGGAAGAGHVAAAVGHVADSTAAAVKELKAAMPAWLEPGLAGYVPVDGRPRAPRDVAAYVDFLTRVHPVGSPEHCAETLLRTARETGIDRFILLVEGAGEPRRVLENVRRLGAEVLPLLRRGGATGAPTPTTG